jgi:ABC-type multidrug transport system fused ATPase/permease subunit
MKKVGLIYKIRYLLTHKQKKQVLFLFLLLFIGTILEMAGLGILIPALGLLITPDIGTQYPVLKPYLEMLGNPTQQELVIGGMVILVLLYLFKSVFLIFLTWQQNKFTSKLAASLSNQLYSGYLNQPYPFHLERNSAFLIRNIQSDIAQFSNVCQAAITMSLEFSLLGGVALLLIISEPFGALSVCAFLIISAMVFQRMTRKKLLFWGRQKQQLIGFSTRDMQQGFGGIKDIKVLGREDAFYGEFKKHNESYYKVMMRIGILNLFPRAYLEFLAVAGLSILIVIMVLQGRSLETLLPTIGIFVAAAFRMIPSVNRVMASMQTIRFSKPVIDTLYDEFKYIHAFQSVNSNAVSQLRGYEFQNIIEINNVSFRYNSAATNAIEKVAFAIKKGESIGLIGPSGSGKSTLVDIILGLLKPTEGRIQVDGQDIAQDIRKWQSQIGYVPQTIYLTDDSIKNNIALGLLEHEIDMDALKSAIHSAHLIDFINDLPEKENTIVGERGVKLSGGQKQRIGIARALYHDPSILILDEATSALDNETESIVMRQVDELKGSKTLIIIAHRLSTLQNCDTILHIESGKIRVVD